ncbi:MAG: hypothetical protein GXO28_03085 [Methanopyri archaeon]|nr:hypothetical protein [Methanopyri archaeon]
MAEIMALARKGEIELSPLMKEILLKSARRRLDFIECQRRSAESRKSYKEDGDGR